jgi:hypothetical protein
LILKKHQELQQLRQTAKDNWQDQTKTQRQAVMEAQRKELEDWAKKNGIDINYLHFGFGPRGGHRGFGR